jgi:hypothetical protein
MAARLNRRHQDMVRKKIQTTKLIQRLQGEALGELTMTDGQRDSAKFLVNKALSNAPTDLNVAGSMNINWPLPKSLLDV